MEYETSDGDYLTVDIELISSGVLFTMDAVTCEDDLWFSDSIVQDGNEFIMPYDEYFEDLDYYLQEIDREVIEGYLIPNNLFKS